MKQYSVVYTTDNLGVTRATRCVLAEGIRLWEIQATYAKSVPNSVYYYTGRDRKEAKERFLYVLGGWMKISQIREISDAQEAEAILTDPYKMPV